MLIRQTMTNIEPAFFLRVVIQETQMLPDNVFSIFQFVKMTRREKLQFEIIYNNCYYSYFNVPIYNICTHTQTCTHTLPQRVCMYIFTHM